MTDDAAWVEGHRAGYVKGRDDGISIGYMDAKLRLYLALDALEATEVFSKTKGSEIRQAFGVIIGKRDM